MPALSTTFFAHLCIHSKKSAISLYWKKLPYQPRLARNQFSGQHSRSDPCVSSVTTAIMITTSDSSWRRSGMLNQLLDVLRAHHRDVRAVPRTNRTSSPAHNPTACATSSTNERLICAPMATLAVFLPRRITRWKYLLRHSGMLRTVTWAASTSKKRNIEFPCFVMCPSRRRLPLDFSSGTNPK